MNAEVVVLGMGPGGEHVATELAKAGMDVVGVEKELLGGECPYWACVPTKMMVRASDAAEEGERVNQLAGRATVERSWTPVARRIREDATDDWNDTAAVDRFNDVGGRFVRGAGRLDGPRRVVVGDEPIDVSRAIVVATGTRPKIPPIEGLDGVEYWTNRGAVAATEVPQSLVIVGAGAVGCEFAQVFARFGSQVTLLEGQEHVLPREETEACDLLHQIFRTDGIDVRAEQAAKACSPGRDGVVVTLESGRQVSAERMLLATGRKADLAAIATSTIGVDESEQWIPVDDHLRVNGAPGVWAIGDVVGGGFTHMAVHHARIVVADVRGESVPGTSDKAKPRVTFTDPEVGAVGLTERQARDGGLKVRTGMSQVPSSARGWIHKVGNEGFIKLVEDRGRGVLVGATSMGPVGGEVLSMLTLAIQAEVPCQDLRHMIYAYPTFHRAVEDALMDLAGAS
ncbi:MAG TPA: NAD(P)/FAD-dependent oxidoreductase [Acidimicrobiales bacterium]|nr:NAD(P)/FAD-dependent oxidoreductase [Acidimicrobiales bacterium]